MRTALIAALVILATLTREAAGLFICLLVFVDDYRNVKRWMVAGLCFASVFVGLRLWIDAPPTQFTPAYVWHLNTETYRIQEALLFLPLLALLAVVLRVRVTRKMLMVLVPYFALVAIFGVWREVRLLMPFWLLVLYGNKWTDLGH